METSETIEQLKSARDTIGRMLDVCKRHDSETGFYKSVSPYEILEAIGKDRLTKINQAVNKAEGEEV